MTSVSWTAPAISLTGWKYPKSRYDSIIYASQNISMDLFYPRHAHFQQKNIQINLFSLNAKCEKNINLNSVKE